MNPLTDRREFLRQTSAASLACLGALVPSAVARAAEATGGQRLRAGTAAGRHHAAEVPGAGLRRLSKPLGHGGL